MSEVLARIRVRETHGIRRFLYPLTAYVNLPQSVSIEMLSLATEQDMAVPLQVIRQHGEQCRVDFAVSMAPLQEDVELFLTEGGPQIDVPDPLHLIQQADGKLLSTQERFNITLGPMGGIEEVVYDGVKHLRMPLVGIESMTAVERPDPDDRNFKRGLILIDEAQKMPVEVVQTQVGGGPLSAWYGTEGIYADGCAATVWSEITACKSWVNMTYRLERTGANETVLLYLPLGGSFEQEPPERTTFDTGINGIYGQTNYWGASLKWVAPSVEGGPICWEVKQDYVSQGDSSAPRIDYVGIVSEHEFPKQLWFHMADGKKAIAVAITKLPAHWSKLEISLRKTIRIRLLLAEEADEPMEFGVCYHFLNDVPAIAAATNPQSILLPPVVEVLPV